MVTSSRLPWDKSSPALPGSLCCCNSSLGQQFILDAELDLQSGVAGSEPSHAGQITPSGIDECLSLEQQRVQEGWLEGQKERRCRTAEESVEGREGQLGGQRMTKGEPEGQRG